MVISDAPVAAQYESWVYPNPIPDMVEAIVTGGYQDASDPARFRVKLWPKKVEPEDLDILIAGCGSNQAAFIALRNPEARVVGIDLSLASLAHEQYLKEKHELHNLELHQLELEQAASLGRSFDLIISSGVLHHLPDPAAGLRALGDVLRPHGVISLMLYGYYPRVGVHMLQEAFRLIGLKQDAAAVHLVRHTLEHIVPPWHHVQSYAKRDRDQAFDAGLVDTYLHARERAYTVADVLQLIEESHLKFQGWLDNLDYSIAYRIRNPNDPLRQKIEALPLIDQWRCVELLGQALARQFVLVCHRDRPESDYAINFDGDEWLDYVPSLRTGLESISYESAEPNAGSAPTSLVATTRYGHRTEFSAFESGLFARIDGKRTILEILDEEGLDASNALQRVRDAREFFQRMADLDHFLYQIP
jgi:SAM-dependent methyltransferase